MQFKFIHDIANESVVLLIPVWNILVCTHPPSLLPDTSFSGGLDKYFPPWWNKLGGL